MTRALPAVDVEGVAFWAARLPGWQIARAVMRGEQQPHEAAASRPAPTLLAPTERRRAPDTVALALEVAARACEAAGRTPAELPAVFASTHGDLAISDYMCATLAATPTLLSPTRFHNSVHNAAAGYWSIGTGSYAAYTAISAFHYTFATGLLEAVTQVACSDAPVLYVAFDIEAKGALATMAPSRGLLGVALVLAPAADEQRHRRLALQIGSSESVLTTPARSAASAIVADNALAPCLPLFEALAVHGATTVRLALGERAALEVQVT
jgi:Beta-ketoacyl synthase, N-terminal domain